MSIAVIYAFGVLKDFILAKHQRICTRDDFMSILHLLPAAKSQQAYINLKQVRNTYRAPFVIYADFELIF